MLKVESTLLTADHFYMRDADRVLRMATAKDEVNHLQKVSFESEVAGDYYQGFQLEQDLVSQRQVAFCLMLIDTVERLRFAQSTVNLPLKGKQKISPYSAKHLVEYWCGSYIRTLSWLVAGSERSVLSPRSRVWEVENWIAGVLMGIRRSAERRSRSAELDDFSRSLLPLIHPSFAS